ncbi:MAG: acyl-CoA dehydrogenase family protein [Frankiaceae bacterium]
MTVNPSAAESRKVAEAARDSTWNKPSFAKELFLGRFRLDLIHPHPTLPPEAIATGAAFIAKFEQFLREEVDGEEIERDSRIPEHVMKGIKEIGALGMKIPEEYGGLGLTQVYYNHALMLAGSVHSSLATLLSAHQSIGVPEPVKHFGTEEQKRKFLPRVATDAVSAFCLTEPDVGSDPARMGTKAVPTEDGSEYIVNGTKLWTTNGTIAELLVVMALVPRSEGHRGGITAFVVEANSPGIEVTHRNAFMGLKGIENGVTVFTDVRVPAENRLDKEGSGLKIALSTLNTGRLSLPAIAAGSAKFATKISREWGSTRVQWGRPVGAHGAIAEKIAHIAGMAFGLEAVVEMASIMADEKRNDIRIEAALAKLWSSEQSWLVVDELMQIRGGRGYETAASLKARGERGVPVEQLLRDIRINRTFEGSSEIMKLLIARDAVDQHLSVAGDIIDPDKGTGDKAKALVNAGKFYSKWFPTLTVGAGQTPNAYADFGVLATHLRYVERSSRKVARSTFYGMSRWQGKLEFKQVFLGRIVDIGCELFAISAAVVRARMLLDNGSPEAQQAVELADVFCKGARRRADHLFHDLWFNDDDDNSKLAKAVLEGRYTFVEKGVIDASGDGPFLKVDREKAGLVDLSDPLPSAGI